MRRHVLRNALIPILTQVVVAIPVPLHRARCCSSRSSASRGSARSPSTRSTANDFATLRTMVFIGALLFILGQILTDLSYALVDPRVRLE